MKIKSVFIWTACLVILIIAHGMTGITEASAFLNVTPTSLSYQATAGGSSQSASVNVANMGNSPVSVAWTYSVNWLIDLKPGLALTIQPGQVATFTLTASSAGFPAGTYTGTATISTTSAQGSTPVMQVPLTLTVTSGSTAPTLGVSPTSMSFSATAGGANPASKTLSISNTGSGSFGWSVFDDAQWLTLSTQAGSNNGSVTVNVNSAGLAAGTYNGMLSIYTTVQQMKTIPVSLTVTAAGGGSTTPTTGSATLSWSPSPSSNISGYRIYSATSPGQYSTPIAILGNVTSYQAIGLRTNTTYFFVVTAVDGAGKESLYSNEVYKTVY